LRANFKLLGVVGTIEERDSEGRWVVQAKEILRMIERDEDVKIENRVIKGDLDLSKVNLNRDLNGRFIVTSVIIIRKSEISGFVNFENTSFGDENDPNKIYVEFINTIFKGNVCFKNAHFFGHVEFSGSHFRKRPDFDYVHFDTYVDFYYAKFIKGCGFYEAVFGKYEAKCKSDLFLRGENFHETSLCADFSHAMIGGNTNFDRAYFYKVASFAYTTFGKGSLILTNILFSASAYFDNAHFKGEVFFNNVKFSDNAIFRGTQFDEDVIFTTSEFSGYSRFTRAKFNGDVYFDRVVFKDHVRFSRSKFNLHVEFVESMFEKAASFEEAKFEDNANFNNGKFKKYADFRGSQFGRYADFFGTHFDEELNLTRATFTQLAISWDLIREHLTYDSATYLLLVETFKRQGIADDSDNCYYEHRKISQKEKNWYETETSWLHRFNWSKLYDHVAWRSCGYGVRPSFTLAWIFGSILGFASFYRIFDGITKSSPPEIAMSALNNSTLLFTFAPSGTSPSIRDCLYFSALSFAGGTPAGLSPVGIWKYAVMFESVLGYLFLALFIVVLAKLIR